MNHRLLKKAIDAYISKADNDLEDKLNLAGFVDSTNTVQSMSSIEEQLAEALKELSDRVLDGSASVEDLKTFANDIWPKIKLDSSLQDSISKIIKDEFKKIIPELANSYLNSIDPELTILQMTKRTVAWIEDWSSNLAKIMNLTTESQIEKILVDGLENGNSINDFTQRLMESGIRDEYYRARKAAITEVLTAHSVAQQESFVQSPAVEKKAWAHTGAHKNTPRENHVAINNQQVLVNETFVLEGADGVIYYPLYPRDVLLPPGERINCHCISQPIVSEDVLGMSLEKRKALQAKLIKEDDGKWEKELDAKNKAKAGIEPVIYKPDKTVYTEIYRDIRENYNVTLNKSAQNRHIIGTDGYTKGRSVLSADANELIKLYQGKGELRFTSSGKWTNKEVFTHTETIGIWKSSDGSFSEKTNRGMIHYSKRKGLHIVPCRP